MLLAAYGITFTLLQGKLPGLTHFLSSLSLGAREGSHFFERMFECAFCTGFHAGWVVYLMVGGRSFSDAVVFAFGSAAFCYLCDLLLLMLEGE
jgi:hypothetical protein